MGHDDGGYGNPSYWRDLAWIASISLAVLAGFAIIEWQRTGGQPGAPLDDVYIHYQFARNLATGNGLAFNPGQPTPGSTSPLWAFLLAGLYRLFGDLFLGARAMSAVAFMLTALTIYVLAWRILADRNAALLAGILTALSGRLAWAGMSGMETMLFTLITLLGLLRHDVERRDDRPAFASAALFGLASLLRPEGYLLFALSSFDRWIERWQRHKGDRNGFGVSAQPNGIPTYITASWSSWLALEAGAVGLYAAFVIPYLFFSYRTTGHLMPNTFRIVSGDVKFSPLRYGLEYLRTIWNDHPLLTALLPVGLVAWTLHQRQARLWRVWLRREPSSRAQAEGRSVERKPALPLLWAVGLPLISAWLTPRLRHHGRYTMPLIPLYVLIGVAGLMALLAWWRERTLQKKIARWGRAGLIALILALSLATAVRWAEQFAWNVDNINDMHVALGHWADENTPPGAALALNDIGAIGYISQRPVIDVVGLVTPEVIDVLKPLSSGLDRDAALCRFLSYRDPPYVMLLPNWYPTLTQNKQVLAPVHAVRLARNTIAGGQEMVVYAPRWPYLRVPAPAHPMDASLGGQVRLRGFDLNPTQVQPGGGVRLTLYWESTSTTETSYKVFVHLVDEVEHIWGQHDGYPVDGLAPTYLWQPGDVVRDEHILTVAPDAPPGEHRLVVGLYDEATMERLAVETGPDAGGGRIILRSLKVQ
jgi:hypothetical protein